VGRCGGRRHAARPRWLSRRACPGDSAKHQGLRKQPRGHCYHGGRPHDHAARPHDRSRDRDREAVPDCRPAGLRATSGPAIAVTVAVALALAVEVTLAVEVALSLAFVVTVTVADADADDYDVRPTGLGRASGAAN
jgi:hypothetical protein